MLRRSSIGLAALNVVLAAPWNSSHAQLAPNVPAPTGCVWRSTSEPVGGKLRLRCQQADGTWSYWNDPDLDEHTVADAQAGDARAMTRLGAFYDVGAPQNLRDPRTAMVWYRKAAAKGHGAAMTQIGLLYVGGSSVPKNDSEADRWLLAGANAGDPKAMFIVGVRYQRGEGLPKDDALARHWHLEAAERGQIVSMSVVSAMYRDGVGGPKDPAEAVRWRQRYEEAVCAERRVVDVAFGLSSPGACGPKEGEPRTTDLAQTAADAAKAAADDAAKAAADAAKASADEATGAAKCAGTKEGC